MIIEEVRAESDLKLRILELEKEKVRWASQRTADQPKRQADREEIIVVEAKPDAAVSSDEIRKLVEENLDAASQGLQINRIRTTKSNKVIISTTKAHKEQIKSNLNEKISEKCRARDVVDPVPKIILLNVEKGLDKEKISEAIKQQNSELFEQDSRLEVEHVFSAQGSDVQNVVIQTDAATRRRILNQPRIYIHNSAAKPDHYISDMFCSKCSRHGHKHHLNHPTKKCRREYRCIYCSASHDPDECPNKNDKSKHQCANCIDHNIRMSNPLSTV